MKILFTCQPAFGHLHPLIPLAQAFVKAEHQVAFVSSASFCPIITRLGFECFPGGLDWLESEAEKHFPELHQIPLIDQGDWFLSVAFADIVASAMVPDLLTIAREWQPDLIVRDYWEFAGYLVGEKLAIPHVTAGIGRFIPMSSMIRLIGPQMNVLRQQLALPSDPNLETLFRHRYLHFFPTSYQPLREVLPNARAARPLIFDQAEGQTLPAWFTTLPAQPTVYATLGTVFNKSIPIFSEALLDLQTEALNLILTVSHDLDPQDFGLQPPQVHIERYIPQTLLLPHCDLVICHGGYNTLMAALSFGVPLLIIPISDDHPYYAERSTVLGVAITLEPQAATPTAFKEAVSRLLTEPTYRANARRLQQEIAAMPGPETVVRWLEETG